MMVPLQQVELTDCKINYFHVLKIFLKIVQRLDYPPHQSVEITHQTSNSFPNDFQQGWIQDSSYSLGGDQSHIGQISPNPHEILLLHN